MAQPQPMAAATEAQLNRTKSAAYWCPSSASQGLADGAVREHAGGLDVIPLLLGERVDAAFHMAALDCGPSTPAKSDAEAAPRTSSCPYPSCPWKGACSCCRNGRSGKQHRSFTHQSRRSMHARRVCALLHARAQPRRAAPAPALSVTFSHRHRLAKHASGPKGPDGRCGRPLVAAGASSARTRRPLQGLLKRPRAAFVCFNAWVSPTLSFCVAGIFCTGPGERLCQCFHTKPLAAALSRCDRLAATRRVASRRSGFKSNVD